MPSDGGNAYGADFSPSGKYVYASTYTEGGNLFRWDIETHTTQTDLENNAEFVGSAGTIDNENTGQVARAADGKMYWVHGSDPNTLSVVNDPDNPGDPDFDQYGFELLYGQGDSGLPQMATGCPPVLYDYGDAPDTYGTLAASNGPQHAINPDLLLGERIDGETDGQ